MLPTNGGLVYHTRQVEKSLERKNYEKDPKVCYRLFRFGPHGLDVLGLHPSGRQKSTRGPHQGSTILPTQTLPLYHR